MKLEKSCQTEMLMGSQTPSVRIVPAYAYTDGEDAVKILAVGRLIVDPWQENVLKEVEDIMVKGYDGSLTFERDFVAEGIEMLNRIQM